MKNQTIAHLRKILDAKEASVTEVVASYRDRITAHDGDVNSFITQNDETHEAEEAAQYAINNKKQHTLTGIPYAAKDLFCTKNLRTTAGSNILKNYVPPYSATVVERCGDAVLLGKTNMDEFAMGSSNEFSAFGPVRNPYDPTRVAGGSSGGSAAAVCAGFAPFALGTDTGGSIRLPASFCNVVGFKPTYGRISRYGAIAMASSLDTVGTFTNTVEDAALLLNILSGEDGFDSTILSREQEDFTRLLSKGMKGIRIGIPEEFRAMQGCDAEILARYEESIRHCEQAGATIVDVALPHTRYALSTYYVLTPSEVSSNLARYDGMQFGERAASLQDLDHVIQQTREEGFGPEAKRRIMIGTFCLSAGFVDAYYNTAQKVRSVIVQEFDRAFATTDVIFSPISPTPAFPLGERTSDPLRMYLTDIFTIPASLAGLPAISLPSGFIDGLPIGMQFIAPHRAESLLLGIAHDFFTTFPKTDQPLAFI